MTLNFLYSECDFPLSFQDEPAYLDAFHIDPGADKLLPHQRGFGVSTGDRVEDISFHVHLLSQLHCRDRDKNTLKQPSSKDYCVAWITETEIYCREQHR